MKEELFNTIKGVITKNNLKEYLGLVARFPQLGCENHLSLFSHNPEIKAVSGYYNLKRNSLFVGADEIIYLKPPVISSLGEMVFATDLVVFETEDYHQTIYTKNELLFKVLRNTSLVASPVHKSDIHLRDSDYYIDYQTQLLYYDEDASEKQMVAVLLHAYVEHYLNTKSVVDRGDDYKKARKNALYYILSNSIGNMTFDTSFIYMSTWIETKSQDFFFDFFREVSQYSSEMILNLRSVCNTDKGVVSTLSFNFNETILLNHYLYTSSKKEFVELMLEIKSENFFRDIAQDIDVLLAKIKPLKKQNYQELVLSRNAQRITVFPQYFLTLQ